MDLRYGINPHQSPATAAFLAGEPFRLLNGQPSYINLLDALNAWQLVREAHRATGLPAATCFKHVSPAGAAIAGSLDDTMVTLYGVDRQPGALTSAYVRARDADPKSSYGDFVAVSEPVDEELADLLARVVSDGIIAPGFDATALQMLRRKRSGAYVVLEIDERFEPPAQEVRDVFGVRLIQPRDATPITREVLGDVRCGALSEPASDDVLLGLVTLRYTQSNSVAFLKDGMTYGVGAGQQSRVDCTKLAGEKARTWWMRRHPSIASLPLRSELRLQDRINWQIRWLEGDLTPEERRLLDRALIAGPSDLTSEEREAWLAQHPNLTLVSDGLIPFRDNIDQAHRYGATCVAEPGGSVRSHEVLDACREHGMTLIHTHMRVFHH